MTIIFWQNGFNPIWEETAEFKLVYPELAFVEFRVKSGDYSKTDDHLGSFIAPFASLRYVESRFVATNHLHMRFLHCGVFFKSLPWFANNQPIKTLKKAHTPQGSSRFTIKACFFRSALCFQRKYLGWCQGVATKVFTSKTHGNSNKAWKNMAY